MEGRVTKTTPSGWLRRVAVETEPPGTTGTPATLGLVQDCKTLSSMMELVEEEESASTTGITPPKFAADSTELAETVGTIGADSGGGKDREFTAETTGTAWALLRFTP